MLQMENINKIEYLKQVIEELKTYSVSLEKESKKLDLLISNYKLKKEKDQKEDGFVLKFDANPETELSVELMNLEMDLEIYILFLELIHLTEDWNLDVNLEKFNIIENKLEKIVLTFGDINLQKEIYKRYHNLLLKKILNDYQEEKEEYINYYQDLKKFPYLIESIQSYGTSSFISLPEHLENYTLETILEEYLFTAKQEIISIEEKEVKVEVTEEKSTIHTLFRKKLKQIQYQLKPFAYLGKAKEEVIQKIGIEKAKAKDFSDQDLSGIDLSTVDFTDVWIGRCDLRNTFAHINPQTIDRQTLYRTNLEGLDLSHVYIVGTNLKNTGAHIDPQMIEDKSIAYANLENLDLSSQDFTGCDIEGANLKGTNAHIDPQKVVDRSLKECNLEGLDLFDADFSGVNIIHANLKNTYAYIIANEVIGQNLDHSICLEGCFVKVTKDDHDISLFYYTDYCRVDDDPKKLLERYGNKKDVIIKVIGLENAIYHNFNNADFSNVDLSDIDFSSLSIFGANLEGTNAFINLNEINSRWINLVKKKGNLSGCRVILSSWSYLNKQFDLTNAIILDNEETVTRKLIQR